MQRELGILKKTIFGGFVLIAFLSTGCASANKSGYLTEYERLHQGRYLESYWADTALNQQTVSRIFIGTIDTSGITDHPNVTLDDASHWLKTSTVSSIQAQSGWQVVDQPDTSTSKLFLAITFLTPGSAAGRMFAGEFGMGHAIVQVEGKLIDSSSGKEVACFADRRRDSAVIGLEDLAGDAGPRIVKHMLMKIGSDFIKELSAGLK